MDAGFTAASKINGFLMGAGIVASLFRTITASPVLATYPLTSILGG